MYKTELIRSVSKKTGLSQATVNKALTASLNGIAESLEEGHTVTLPGFGTFYTRTRKPSTLTSVATGKAVTVPALRVAAFRVGEVLKRAVRRQGAQEPPRRGRGRGLRGLLTRATRG